MKRCLPALLIVFAAACHRPASDHSGGTTTTPPPTPPPPVLTSITVAPGSAAVDEGDGVIFSATEHYSDGSSKAASVTWSSDDPAVASVNAGGAAIGVAPGSTQIRATSTVDPALDASGTLTVNSAAPVFVYGCQDGVGIVRYLESGGLPSILALSAAPGGSLPDWSSLSGIAPVNGGLYLLETANGSGGTLWYVDLATNVVTSKGPFGLSTNHFGLVADSQGRVYTVTNMTAGEIFRWDPSTGQSTSWVVTGVPLAFDLLIDASDNLYVADFWPSPGGAWIHKVTPSGTVTPIMNAPASAGTIIHGGMAFDTNGSLLAGNALTGGQIYRGQDLNGDGDFLDAGETAAVTSSYAALFGLSSHPDGILANDPGTSAVYLLKDLDGNGDYFGTGESTVWSTTPVSNGWGTDCIERSAP